MVQPDIVGPEGFLQAAHYRPDSEPLRVGVRLSHLSYSGLGAGFGSLTNSEIENDRARWLFAEADHLGGLVAAGIWRACAFG